MATTNKQIEGRVVVDVPVVTSINPSVVGADLTQLADQTSSSLQTSPRTMALFIQLTGSGSVQLQAYVRVSIPDSPTPVDLGWANLIDTGNPGYCGGQSYYFAAPGSYVLLVNFAAIYKQFALLAVNAQGGFTPAQVEEAILIAYDEY